MSDYIDEARLKLSAIVRSSDLSIREVASVFGLSSRTLERHLAGDPIARQRMCWYHALEHVEYSEGERRAVIVVRFTATRKKWGWRMTRDERRALWDTLGYRP